jgi:hypothetical protein
MAGLDLSTIINSANDYMAKTQGDTNKLLDQFKELKNTADNSAQLLETIGSNNVIVNEVVESGKLATQAARNKAAAALGTNLRDSSEQLTSLIAQSQEASDARDQAAAVIQEKKSVGLFDNPIQWILNHATINDDIDRYNGADIKYSTTQARIADLNRTTQETVATQNALNESTSQAAITASSQNLLSEAQIKANAAKAQGLVYGAEGIKAAMNASKEQFQAQQTIFSDQKAQQQIQISLAHLDMARKEFDAKMAEKDLAKMADNQLLDYINQGGKGRLGAAYVDIRPGTPAAAQAIALLKSGSPAGKLFTEDFMAGQQALAIDPTGNTKILGTSAARTANVLAQFPVKLAPAQQPLVDIIQQAVQDVKNAPGFDPKDQQLDAKVNARTAELLTAKAKVIIPGDITNPFVIPSTTSIIANTPAVAGLAVVQKVLAPAIKNHVDVNSPNVVFGLVAQALQDRTISYAEALEATTIYHAGVSQNMQARQMPSLGLTPTFGYRVQIQTNLDGSFGTGRQVVDLTKPDSFGRALNQYMSARIDYSSLGSN